MIHFYTVTHVTLNMYIYIYIHIYTYMYVYIYIEVELYVAINGVYLLARFSLQDMSASHGIGKNTTPLMLIIELDDGTIYRKTLYLMVKTMVSG